MDIYSLHEYNVSFTGLFRKHDIRGSFYQFYVMLTFKKMS